MFAHFKHTPRLKTTFDESCPDFEMAFQGVSLCLGCSMAVTSVTIITVDAMQVQRPTAGST